MSNYTITKTVSLVTTNTSVSDILQTEGGTKNFSNLIGFPTCVPSSLTFEHPSTTGYKINNVDIANSICAKFVDYTGYSTVDGNTGQTINHTVTIPGWCNSLAVIIVGAGGGGFLYVIAMEADHGKVNQALSEMLPVSFSYCPFGSKVLISI